jgi:hypothetical protein
MSVAKGKPKTKTSDRKIIEKRFNKTDRSGTSQLVPTVGRTFIGQLSNPQTNNRVSCCSFGYSFDRVDA